MGESLGVQAVRDTVCFGGSASRATWFTLEVPLDAVAFRGMVGVDRPAGLQGSVAGDVNPRE